MEEKQQNIWRVVQGAVIGKKHIQEGLVCQDKTFIYETSNAMAVALADGAGSAKLSHYGAETVTKEVCKLLCEKFWEFYYSENPMMVKQEILTHLLEALQNVAEQQQCELKDLASTLLAVVICENQFLIVHLGDGVIAYTKENEIKVATTPQNGEFVNRTYFVTSSNALQVMKVLKGVATSIDGFVLMSDGSGASLYSKQQNEVASILQRLVKRLGMTSEEYLQPIIQNGLEEAICQKTGDDCSLVLVSKHFKAYDELDNEEAKEYFDIKVKRNRDVINRKNRYQKILNALDIQKSSKELCQLMGLKNTRNFIKMWLVPLTILGYIKEINKDTYVRTIYPSSCFSVYLTESEIYPTSDV